MCEPEDQLSKTHQPETNSLIQLDQQKKENDPDGLILPTPEESKPGERRDIDNF